MSRRMATSVPLAAFAVTVFSLTLTAGAALAALGDCCQPVTNGTNPAASDCLFILKVAVGSETCSPDCICNPNGDANVTAPDALVCLKKAVGQSVTLSCPCATARIIIVNGDGGSEGFNDPAPRAPVGGNPGTTLGQQRLNVFEYAAELWGQVIESNVDILVDATFDPLFCNSTSAVLGSAGAANAYANFPGALRANTWFSAALADKIAGSDIEPGFADVIATFNSAIGTTCSFPNEWYYGLDGNPGVLEIDLVTVVLHELGHGLGFQTLVNLGTGQKAGGLDDAFMLRLEDHSTAKIYPNMSNAERVTASKDTGDLHYKGAAVIAGSTHLLAGRHSPSGHVRMFAPNPQQSGSSVSHWDSVLSPNELMEPTYTEPLHDVGLAAQLFDDIGWDSMLSALRHGAQPDEEE